MKTKTATLRGAVLSAALSLALVAGLVPAQALYSEAYADTAEESGVAQTEQTTDENAGVESDAAEQSESDAAAAANRVSEDVQLEAAAQDEVPAESVPAAPESAPTADAPEIVSTSVQLGQGAQQVLTSNNLVYTVNADDSTTVTLTGWSNVAPEGALAIPTQIVCGNATYTVTNVSSNKTAGGGSLKI